MSQLYPLKFVPIFKDKIWGGDKVKTVFGMNYAPLPNCGEVWSLSGYGSEISVVSNGFLAENDLQDLIEIYMGDLVGEAVYEKYENTFPLLIKILDANDWLSIQVHPDDELAMERHGEAGKTEMWYVAGAEKGAQLISGFNRQLTPEEYQQHLENGTLEQIMNYVHAKPGDVFFMPAGRVHALGPGLLIFEIQQTSDLTYRIYDFDRVDDKGKKRELHTSLAMDAIDFAKPEAVKNTYTPEFNKTVPVVESQYFCTSLIHFDEAVTKDYSGIDSFVILQCTAGHCRIDFEGGSETIAPGEVILIPAIMEYITIVPLEESKILEVYCPEFKKEE